MLGLCLILAEFQADSAYKGCADTKSMYGVLEKLYFVSLARGLTCLPTNKLGCSDNTTKFWPKDRRFIWENEDPVDRHVKPH